MTEPPLTEAEIVEAERDLGVSFPEEYRTYLREVSAGGALFRLERMGRGWWWADNEKWRRELLAVPFPHPDSYAESDDELMGREPQAESFEAGRTAAEPASPQAVADSVGGLRDDCTDAAASQVAADGG
ncbi:SMI1/KNR4 family protein [Streptomyces sp. B21-105]